MASRTAAVATKATTAAKGKAASKAPAKTNGKAKTPTPVREPEWKTEVSESKVNEQVLQEELRARDLSTRGTTMTLVTRLEKAICASVKAPATIVRCDTCNGRSSSEDARCPFCGDAEPVVLHGATPPGEGAQPPEAPTVEGDLEEAPKGDVAPPAGNDDEVEEPAGEPEPEAHVGEVVDPEAPVDRSGAGLRALFGGRSGPRTDEVLSANDDEAHPSEPPSSSIVLSSEDAAAAAASAGVQPSEDEVKDLDRRVARCRELALALVANAWDLGHELLKIHDSKSWLARRLGSGAPKYRSFSAFIEGEFGNDQSWARKFMAVAKVFTRDQVLARGISRMVLVVQVPEGVRDQLLANEEAMRQPVAGLKAITKLVTGGTPVPEAVAEVTAARASKSTPPPPVVEEEPDAGSDEDDEPESHADDAEPKAAAPKPAAPKGAKVTPAAKPAGAKDPRDLFGAAAKPEKTVNVVTMPGRFQIKLYALPKANKGPLGKKRRAFAISDHARGEHGFDNGSEMRIGLHESPRGLFLVVEMTPPTAT